MLTVEGETEKWYFDWLNDQINKCEDRTFNSSIIAKVQQSPRSFYKGTNAKVAPEAFHICDVESTSQLHTEKFQSILKEMKEANTFKSIKYYLGYSNFTFELWIILHKMDCFSHFNDRKQYLAPIKQCFKEKFEDLGHFKQEQAFKRCLDKLTLADVKSAIARSKKLENQNKANGNKVIKHSGYSYYRENPSLSINEIVEKMLVECGVM